MSAIDQNRAVPLGAVTLFRVTTLFEQITDVLRTWHHARSTARALDGLSDRSLDDIGVKRAEIPGVAQRLAKRG